MIVRPDLLPGQGQAVDQMQRAMANGRFPQSLLIVADDPVLTQITLLWTLGFLLCHSDSSDKPCGSCSSCQKLNKLSHSDTHFIFPMAAAATVDDERDWISGLATDFWHVPDIPDTAEILVRSIRDIHKMVSQAPIEGDRQVFLVLGADRMRKEAANAFLKVLEEPPAGTYFVLAARSLSLVIPTIVSRCQIVKLRPPSHEDIQAILHRLNLAKGKESMVAYQAGRSLTRAIQFSDEDQLDLGSTVIPFLEAVKKGNLNTIYQEFKQWEQGGASGLLLLIDTLLLFLSDAHRLSAGEKKQLNRPDWAQSHPDLFNAYGHLNLQTAISDLEDLRYKARRNVNVQLILMNIAIQLRKQFRATLL